MAQVRAQLSEAVLAVAPANMAAAVSCLEFLDHCNALLWQRKALVEGREASAAPPPPPSPRVPPLVVVPPPPPPPPRATFGTEEFWDSMPADAASRFLAPTPARFVMPAPWLPPGGLFGAAVQEIGRAGPQEQKAPPKRPGPKPGIKRGAAAAAAAEAVKSAKKPKVEETPVGIEEMVRSAHNLEYPTFLCRHAEEARVHKV